MSGAIEVTPSPARPPRRWRLVLDATILATWALMLLGALTRASMAGTACPDWPLCHGYVVPPLDGAAYPGGYRVYEVYLEFGHRVLAAVAGGGALAAAAWAWRRALRTWALVLVGTLAAQVAAGAATVWLGNAPYTVVLHLALALAFLSALLVVRRRIFPARPGPVRGRLAWGAAYAAAASLTAVQMLVGASVSSQYFGLACPDWPSCASGRLWPPDWTAATAWQVLHRGLGVLLAVAVVAIAIAAFARASGAVERRLAGLLGAGLAAQALLGGVTVWLGIPPWASALHLGVAAALFAALSWRVAGAFGPSGASSGALRPVHG